jgi:hypothetical protein
VQLHLRINTEDVGLRDILERILTGVIVFDPSARLLLTTIDLTAATRVVVAPERRHRPFIIPEG